MPLTFKAMDFSKIKMVVSDMDGTLLNSNHEVSHRFFELFHKLKEKGIQFVAASGRQYHSMVTKLDAVKDDVIFIAENGAIIREQENEISSTPLSQELVRKLISKIQEIDDASLMLCGKYTSFFDGSSSLFLNELIEYYSNYKVVDNFHTIEEDIVKIAVYHGISSEDFLYPEIQHFNSCQFIILFHNRLLQYLQCLNNVQYNVFTNIRNCVFILVNVQMPFSFYTYQGSLTSPPCDQRTITYSKDSAI